MNKQALYEWMHTNVEVYGNKGHGKGYEYLCNPYESICDVGGGFTTFALDTKCPYKTVTDISIIPMETQNKRGVAFWNCAAHQLNFKSDSIDIVTCFDVLEHIEPQFLDMSIANIFRIAKYKVLISVGYNETTKTINGEVYKLHEIVESFKWWKDKISQYGKIISENKERKSFFFECETLIKIKE